MVNPKCNIHCNRTIFCFIHIQ